ncbi:helix-turn-helix transcriptional regulator [Streptacidiphilus sp. P02-A3a]|uniref:helix-turn-helix domain-containing protein n=1 Tax=Streptacidiphilus sp. P02-A3a TaxID=2704468 RepID=UPI0015F8C674|nr:helix-turn-helix transcriptional regulator [Streptacidiphilus sp. P02-A3a]QMU71600.1 helix-turn-helix transcriptional regulator [Streptacidiphilus sp. P02-A3a]
MYARATSQKSVSRDDLLKSVDSPLDDTQRAIDRLVELRVLRSQRGRPDMFTPVAPATAGAQLLLPVLRAMGDQQAMINDVSAHLSALLPIYEGSALERAQEQLLERLDDVDDVRAALSELAARATREILVSQPGGPRAGSVAQETRDRTMRALERGVPTKTLYQYSAQFHQPTYDHVALAVERGAEVRVVSDAFMRLIVFDRKVALIDLVDNERGSLLVRDPNIVHFLTRAFAKVWDTALPFPFSYERAQVLRTSEAMKIAIVGLLVEGYDDKVVAKRLGISLRTFQRHLSEVLRRIGARSRLHAGYLIREHRVLEGKFDATHRPADSSVNG